MKITECIILASFGIGFLMSLAAIGVFVWHGKDATAPCWCAFWCGIALVAWRTE